MAGDAVALADFAMVANDLSEGRLVRPFYLSIKVSPEYAYFLVYPEGTANDPRVIAFRDWIIERNRRASRKRISSVSANFMFCRVPEAPRLVRS